MGNGRIIGSCGQKTAIGKDKWGGAQQATKCPKKQQLGTNFACCKSTIWPGNGIFAEKNQPIINLFDPKTLQKNFDLQFRSAGNAIEGRMCQKVKRDRNTEKTLLRSGYLRRYWVFRESPSGHNPLLRLTSLSFLLTQINSTSHGRPKKGNLQLSWL